MLELSYRGERLMNELAQKFHQVNRLVEHDPLWRSKHLPSLLQKVCEGLRHVQLLISREFQEVTETEIRTETYFEFLFGNPVEKEIM
eukprot:symbB.v1.2.037049.t3/scaffold5368.1/size49870/1